MSRYSIYDAHADPATDEAVCLSVPMSEYRRNHFRLPVGATKCGTCWDEGWVRAFFDHADLRRHFVAYHIFDTGEERDR